jgi:hypothetical protein
MPEHGGFAEPNTKILSTTLICGLQNLNNTRCCFVSYIDVLQDTYLFTEAH